ncbi:hypothetical protein MHYP_G00158770 [Metynnis hypsauchen]
MVAVILMISGLTKTQTVSPSLFYPFGSGAGDTVNPRNDDGSSSAINLQSRFSFFGHLYSQLFVNNNGHLTFDQSSNSYTPVQFSTYRRDIIAPFWTDIDNRATGNISYNQYTSGSVLLQATRDVNQYFPGVNFGASWVFVATWDKVAYYSYSGTQTSVQVVLISDGSSSFVLMNYGPIAPTNGTVEAGYGTSSSDGFQILWSSSTVQANVPNLINISNVDVPGRWAFTVSQGAPASTAEAISKTVPISFTGTTETTSKTGISTTTSLSTTTAASSTTGVSTTTSTSSSATPTSTAVRLKVTSLNLKDTFLQQLQVELWKRGMPTTVRVKLILIKKTS